MNFNRFQTPFTLITEPLCTFGTLVLCAFISPCSMPFPIKTVEELQKQATV